MSYHLFETWHLLCVCCQFDRHVVYVFIFQLELHHRTRNLVYKCFYENPHITKYVDGNHRRAHRIVTSTQLAVRQ